MSDIKLFHGDCLELMKQIPDKSIDMILCDLPYGTTACKWDIVIPFDELWRQYTRIIKDKGCIALFGQEPFSSFLRLSNLNMFRYDWYWNKTKQGNFAQAPYMPLKNIETVSIFSKGTIAKNSKIKMNYYPQGVENCNKINNGGNKSNAFRPNRKEKDKDHIQTKTNYPKQLIKFDSCYEFKHPTQKPVELLEYLIKTYTNEGDTVLDNCMGSDSTGVASKNLNRDFIGIELDEHYFEIANSRILDNAEPPKSKPKSEINTRKSLF
jgi:site-specific DNA-methyltransferase (adenine-specific)